MNVSPCFFCSKLSLLTTHFWTSECTLHFGPDDVASDWSQWDFSKALLFRNAIQQKNPHNHPVHTQLRLRLGLKSFPPDFARKCSGMDPRWDKTQPWHHSSLKNPNSSLISIHSDLSIVNNNDFCLLQQAVGLWPPTNSSQVKYQ